MQNTITPVAPTTPTPPVESRPSPRSASPHAFATLLRQSQAPAANVAKAAPVPRARTDGGADASPQAGVARTAANAAGSAATAAADARRRDDARSTSEATDTTGSDTRAEAADAADAADRGDKDKADTAHTLDVNGASLPLTHGLVALHRLPAAAPESDSRSSAGQAERSALSSAGDGAESGGAATQASAQTLTSPRGAADLARPGETPPSTIAAASAADASSAKAADAALVGAAKSTPFTLNDLHADAPLPAAALPTPGAAPSAASAPTEVTVATPMTAPDFGQAFAVQVSVLVQDGVHSAELHLNPVEMGPVSVQIVVDGTQARIEFGADALATRQAIEAGLPELASALRDAGMTLQGGGVSQHARDPNEGGKPGDSPSSPRDLWRHDDPRPTPTLRQRTVAAGGVDLYA